ncbi:hypothetical protein HS088_TW15G00676 [Tripterygium wilfordii]|uniref:Uncharacterized protein n=1 Tax=Tripterygium wilfordii TaxID=458696 RepID=A0A7J7CMN6_TRIWF|nr:hypothetical protein HS088_TW15G00676 [Tripterygium wilfordii]
MAHNELVHEEMSTYVSQLMLSETGKPTLIWQAVGILFNKESFTLGKALTAPFKHRQIAFLSSRVLTVAASCWSPLQQAGARFESLPIANPTQAAALASTALHGTAASLTLASKNKRERSKTIEKKMLFIVELLEM